MMKFLLILIFFMFIFMRMEYFLIQMFLQCMFFFMTFMFLVNFPMNNLNFWVKIYYNLGCDYYSMGLIILSFWVLGLMAMMSLKNFYKFNYIYYSFMMMLMLIFLILCFMSMNIMMFFMFYESSLLPVFFMIMGWGYQVERIQAGFYMMVYTLVGSMPLFFMIMILYKLNMTLMISFVKLNGGGFYFYIMMVLAFLIKMPMYLTHLWLPKAHVEAPLTGSMILAGVMLKLGGYGLMRFMLMMMEMCMKYNKFIIVISLMGGIYSSIICLFQMDMKVLVAYSSVVHMSLMMAGMMTMFTWGYAGAMMMMIAHGLCSSGLFCLVNMNYERFCSRSLLINKGMINLFPNYSLMWFLMCSSNLSFPPSLNLFSEIFLISALIMWSKKLILLISLIMFFGAAYSLYLYTASQHGLFNKLMFNMKPILVHEYMTLLLHWIPLNLMFMDMYVFL